jgi:hypothetical protein
MVAAMSHRLLATPFSSVYPLYVRKAERKGRTRAEVDEIIRWLTGYGLAEFRQQLRDERTIEEFFDGAPDFNPASSLIKGSVCGVRVEAVKDPLMRRIRLLDKLIDELAKGRPMTKILRSETG